VPLDVPVLLAHDQVRVQRGQRPVLPNLPFAIVARATRRQDLDDHAGRVGHPVVLPVRLADDHHVGVEDVVTDAELLAFLVDVARPITGRDPPQRRDVERNAVVR